MSADMVTIRSIAVPLVMLSALTSNMICLVMGFSFKRDLRFSVLALFLNTAALYIFFWLLDTQHPGWLGLRGLCHLPIVLWLFKGSFFQKVFAVFSQILITSLEVNLVIAVTGYFLSESFEYYLIACSITLILYSLNVFLMLKFGRRFWKKLFANEQRIEWAVYSFGVIFAFFAMYFTVNTSVNAWYAIFMMLFIFFGFAVLCFSIINTHDKLQQRYENDFAQGIIATGQDHYQKMNEAHDAIRILRHDYKYHLKTIGKLIKSGDMEKVEQYLSNVQAETPEDELRHFCSNSVLNALLSSYADRCEKLHICYDVKLALPETPIPNYEMCIILGNLLENAVEAAQPVGAAHPVGAARQSKTDSRIELVVQTQGTHLAIMVKNNYSGELTLADGKPVSAKKDSGFGLRSVRAVAARYDGEVITEWDKETFKTYVMLSMNN